MKLDQEEIHKLVIECLNEAVALDAQKIDLILCCSMPSGDLMNHRNSCINIHQNGLEQAPQMGKMAGISVINALLDKLGIDPLVPLRAPNGLLTGFVDLPKPKNVSDYNAAPTTANMPDSFDERIGDLMEGFQVPLKHSTQVHSFKYDAGADELIIRFQRGGAYAYKMKDGSSIKAIADGLAQADSAGSYVNQVVKGACSFKKLA